MPVIKPCVFWKDLGLLVRIISIKQSLSDTKQVGSITKFFKLKTSNRSDGWFEVSLLGFSISILRIITGKKHPKIKVQRFRKVRIWTFRWLLHQITSLYEVLKLKQNSQKNNVVTFKTLFFVIGSSCIPYPNIGFCMEMLHFQS